MGEGGGGGRGAKSYDCEKDYPSVNHSILSETGFVTRKGYRVLLIPKPNSIFCNKILTPNLRINLQSLCRVLELYPVRRALSGLPYYSHSRPKAGREGGRGLGDSSLGS
jgi:hypothetical protein